MTVSGYVDEETQELVIRVTDGCTHLLIADPTEESRLHRAVLPPERLEVRFKDAVHAVAELHHLLTSLSLKIVQPHGRRAHGREESRV